MLYSVDPPMTFCPCEKHTNMMNAAFIIFLWEARYMGVFDVIATIGTSYVLISLYYALSHIERRYHTVWHSSKKHRRNRIRMPYQKPSKKLRFWSVGSGCSSILPQNGKTNRAAICRSVRGYVRYR